MHEQIITIIGTARKKISVSMPAIHLYGDDAPCWIQRVHPGDPAEFHTLHIGIPNVAESVAFFMGDENTPSIVQLRRFYDALGRQLEHAERQVFGSREDDE